MIPHNLDISPCFRYFDWEKAKTFYYISKMGSFTHASAFLNLSQPALSRQIMSLEHQLGYPLFIRQSRGIVLTRKGKELQTIISGTFNRLSEFTNRDKRDIERGETRTIRIGIEKGYEYLVIGGLESYQRAYPYLTFKIMQDISHNTLKVLDLDIAFRGSGVCADQSDICFLIAETGKNIAAISDGIVISSNVQISRKLYMLIPSSLESDEELKELAQYLQEQNKK